MTPGSEMKALWNSLAPEPFDTTDILMEAIRDRIHDRVWYRSQPRPETWRDLAERNDIELRALLTIARRARRLASAELIPYRDTWTETEKRFAAGDR